MCLRLAALALLVSVAAALPNCEDDVGKHCLGEDADMSPEGIDTCLAALGDGVSADCKTFRGLIAACGAELTESGGVCTSAHANSEGMPCLLQRTSPEALSAPCRAAVEESTGANEPDTSLKGTFWKDGKRKLDEEEQEELSEDDLSLYKKWWKRKQKRSGANSDVNYAKAKVKKAKHRKIMVHKVAQSAQKVLLEDAKAVKAAKKKAFSLLKKEAKTSGSSFTKDELKEMAKDAVKSAQKQIKQDAINAKKAEL